APPPTLSPVKGLGVGTLLPAAGQRGLLRDDGDTRHDVPADAARDERVDLIDLALAATAAHAVVPANGVHEGLRARSPSARDLTHRGLRETLANTDVHWWLRFQECLSIY